MPKLAINFLYLLSLEVKKNIPHNGNVRVQIMVWMKEYCSNQEALGILWLIQMIYSPSPYICPYSPLMELHIPRRGEWWENPSFLLLQLSIVPAWEPRAANWRARNTSSHPFPRQKTQWPSTTHFKYGLPEYSKIGSSRSQSEPDPTPPAYRLTIAYTVAHSLNKFKKISTCSSN